MEKNIFNGIPSIELKNDPILTIVIGCYNTPQFRMKRLLQSIYNTGVNDIIEVNLVDDHSKDLSYIDVVNTFRDKMCIRLFEVPEDHWHGPGASRQLGVDNARGKFLMISDHDDEFIPDGLKMAVNFINSDDGKDSLYIATNFYMVAEDGETVIRQHRGLNSWNHAKIYNIEKLWKPYNIHFYDNMMSHEDICISSQATCAMSHMNQVPVELDIYTYKWYHNADSASNKKMPIEFKGTIYHVPYIFTWFDDYLRSTLDVYIDFDKRGWTNHGRMLYQSMQIISYAYFYLESMISEFPFEMCIDNYNHCINAYNRAKDQFGNVGFSTKSIYDWLNDTNAYNWDIVEANTKVATSAFIKRETFAQYLYNLETGSIHIFTNDEFTKFTNMLYS